MSTVLQQIRDASSLMTHPLHGLPFSEDNGYVVLTASTVKSITVPSSLDGNTFLAFFTYSLGADVWVLPSASPVLTVPDGVYTATKAQLNPAARLVVPGQTIQLIYANTAFAGTPVSVGITYLKVT